MSRALEDGDLVLLVDRKQRRYLVTLASGKTFHSHAGTLDHDQLIGGDEGRRLRTSGGAELVVLRPTFADYVLKMKRGAQVIYPKDIGPILVYGDVFPGAKVVEAGIGSGALTMALLRAVGPDGHVTSYERREDHAAQARANIAAFCGEVPNHELRIGDVSAGIVERGVDRVLLDLPEPWTVVPAAAAALRTGGILLSYLPSVPQVQKAVAAMDEHGFGFRETFEVMQRGWNIDGLSVRPDHRMVAHTGFLTVARLLGD